MKQIKDFVGITVGAVLGSGLIRHIGEVWPEGMNGLRSATQSMVGLSVFSSAAKPVKKLFRF